MILRPTCIQLYPLECGKTVGNLGQNTRRFHPHFVTSPTAVGNGSNVLITNNDMSFDYP